MSKTVRATVNGKHITAQMVDAFYNSLSQNIQQQFQGEEGRERLFDELIYQELFYAKAKADDLEHTEAFQQELEIAKENLLKQFAIRQLIQAIDVTQAEIDDYYAAHQNEFEAPDRVKASHILVDSEEEAKAIKAKIDSGVSFEAAAQAHSKCPSKERGGDLGFFQRGQMVPEFEEAAFDMETGALSEPVKTQFGYHLILKTEAEAAGLASLESVKPQIYQHLLVNKQNQAYAETVTALKAQYPVEKEEA